MNLATQLPLASPLPRNLRRIDRSAPRLALLGSGNVGAAFVARCDALRARGVSLPAFAWLSNSRALADGDEAPADALLRLRTAPARNGAWAPWVEAESLRRGDIVVDATASDSVAGWHSEWLARGIHVVTANKLGNGADLARAQAIADAAREHGAQYGDSATVGAGLPLLRSLRELVAGGDHIRSVEGVLSGSLAWLFDRYDGTRPFSELVRAARDAGYTEPDPRIDLSGEDVRRKLLILARAAGLPLRTEQVAVASLVPDVLAQAPTGAIDALLPTLDAPLRERYVQAGRDGERLRFVGRFAVREDGGVDATVGLLALREDHPLCGGSGTDNRVAIRSCRYDAQPLVVQGPGAGAEVTAAALLDDVLRIASLA
jgi:homoserine dehydrogenase